jgi:ERCC4-related helicase
MDAARSGLYSNSCMIVSASFRQAVDVVVDLLNREGPFIRVVLFIGQEADKNEKEHGSKRAVQGLLAALVNNAIANFACVDYRA